MAKVEIYTSPLCGYCRRAKALLDDLSVEYAERDVTAEPGARAEMTERAQGRTSVPQIFIDGAGVGGSDDLARLHASGELAALLGAGPAAGA